MTLVRRLDENGEPCYGHGTSDFVTGADAVVVLATLALRTNLGEWFLDTSLGVAWLNQDEAQPQVLGRTPADLAFTRAEILRVVSSVEGVDSVTDLQVAFDHRTRVATVTVVIQTTFGGPHKVQVRQAL